MTSDKTLMRVKDLVLLLGAIGGLIVGVGKIYRKDFNLDGVISRLDKLEPTVAQHTTQLAVEDDRYREILRQLSNIDRKINR